jgi:hypothetical protein
VSGGSSSIDVQIFADAGRIRDIALRLEKAGRGDLLKQIQQALDAAAKPLPIAAAKQALSILPRAGGLGALVSRTNISVIRGFTAKRAGVLIKANRGAIKDPAAINRGRVRHPVYGHWPKVPIIQVVRAGWFTDPIRDGAPEVRAAMTVAVADIIKSI